MCGHVDAESVEASSFRFGSPDEWQFPLSSQPASISFGCTNPVSPPINDCRTLQELEL